MSEPQIIVKDLSLGYEGEAVVEGISFTVNKGDYLSILGENGSGKSTLMKALLGLKKPISGTIEYKDGLRAGGIGYLPQQTQTQHDFPASVREIVLSGNLAKCGLRPFYRKDEKELAMKNLERLGIADLADRCYRDLSGGQQQRVLLARALCAAGTLLVLDEPVTGLDPKAQTEMYELIARLNQEGVTMIMVSHDLNMSLKYAGKILHIGDRRQKFFGSSEEYISMKWEVASNE